MLTPEENAPLDVGRLLDTARWSLVQKGVVALAALAVIFDGLDNQLVGIAIPALIKDWHLARAAFAPALALGLVGMSIGSAVAGRLGDRMGRRAALSGSVLLFGAATVAISFVNGIVGLTLMRFLAGAGIGGALPNAAAIAAEFTPFARRAFTVTATIVCVPAGGMVAGAAASLILPAFGWRALFAVGGIAPIVFGALLWFTMPETPRFLARDRRRWPELARLMARMGHELPAGREIVETSGVGRAGESRWGALFDTAFRRDTLCLNVLFLGSLASIYMAFSWLPSLIAAQGLGLAASSNGLAAYNLGGVVGSLVVGGFIGRYGSRGPMVAAAILAAVSSIATGLVPLAAGGANVPLMAAFALSGCFVNAVQTNAFALAAHVYPTEIRATGVAFALAVGRLGSVFSAVIGASVVAAGRMAFAGYLGLTMIGAAAGLMLLRDHVPAARGRR